MSAEIALFEDVPVSQYGNDDVHQATQAGANYLARLEFKSDSNKEVKSRKIPANHYWFIKSKEEREDVGENPIVIALAYRYAAMDFTDKKKFKIFFDPDSADYARCMAEADRRDRPKGEMSPCTYGPQFLLFVSGVGLCTWHAGNWDSKRVAKKMFGLTRRPLVLSSQFIDGDFPRFGPAVGTCPGPIDYVKFPVERLKRLTIEFGKPSGVFEGDKEPEDSDAPTEETAGRVR